MLLKMTSFCRINDMSLSRPPTPASISDTVFGDFACLWSSFFSLFRFLSKPVHEDSAGLSLEAGNVDTMIMDPTTKQCRTTDAQQDLSYVCSAMKLPHTTTERSVPRKRSPKVGRLSQGRP